MNKLLKEESNWIELNIDGLTYNKNSLWKRLFSTNEPTYRLVMSNKDSSNEQIVMIIGKYEAQAIAIVLERLVPVRPLIQDVFKSAVDKFGYRLNHVLINKLEDSRYYSIINYSKDSEEIEIDTRPADSIGMALKHGSPIFIEKTLM